MKLKEIISMYSDSESFDIDDDSWYKGYWTVQGGKATVERYLEDDVVLYLLYRDIGYFVIKTQKKLIKCYAIYRSGRLKYYPYCVPISYKEFIDVIRFHNEKSSQIKITQEMLDEVKDKFVLEEMSDG